MVGWVVGSILHGGARCSSVVRAFAHGAMGRRIDPSWGGPIELFLVPPSVPRLCNGYAIFEGLVEVKKVH